VSRSDISGEYLRAVQDQGLGYAELKRMARASLEHAFVEGASLWTGPRMGARVAACARDVAGRGARSAGCDAFLASSAKARLQMRLEDAYAAFERDVAAGIAPR
jgi:adenosine deaminase